MFLPEIPDWLQPMCLGDDLFAAAYANTTAQERAQIKTCIARHHAFFGVSPERVTQRIENSGVKLQEQEGACPFVLLICPEDFVDPLALIAAVMPPILARVPLTLPCFYTEGDVHAKLLEPDKEPKGLRPSLLVALELAGLEQALFVSRSQLLETFTPCLTVKNDTGPGRVVCLGSSDPVLPLLSRSLSEAIPCLALPFSSSPAQKNAGWTAFMAQMPQGFAADCFIWPQYLPSWCRNKSYVYTYLEDFPKTE